MPRLNAPSAAISGWQQRVRAKSRRSPRLSRYSGVVLAEPVTASQLSFAPKPWRKESASAGVRSQRYKPGSSPVTRCTINTRCKRGGNGQASKGGGLVRGSVVSKIARKVSREMLLTPSKFTALRRWRINWPAEWPQAGGDGGGHA